MTAFFLIGIDLKSYRKMNGLFENSVPNRIIDLVSFLKEPNHCFNFFRNKMEVWRIFLLAGSSKKSKLFFKSV